MSVPTRFSLVSPAFLQVWASYSISEICANVIVAAVPLFAAGALHVDSFEMGLLATAATLPYLLFGPVAGIIADLMPRRSILIFTDVMRSLILIMGFGLAAFNELGFWPLYLLAFGAGAGGVWYDVALGSYVPNVVKRDGLIAANTYLSISQSAAYTFAPVIAGVVLGAASMASLLSGTAVLFAFAATLLYSLDPGRSATSSNKAGSSIIAGIWDGIAFIWNNALLRRLTIRHVLWHFFVGGAYSQLILFLVTELDLSTQTVGWILAASGMGTACAAFSAQALSRTLGVGRAITTSNVLAATAGSLIIFVRVGAWAPIIAALSYFVFGYCVMLYQINNTSLRQSLTPASLMGRMTAGIRTSTWAANMIGAVFAGIAAQHFGARLMLSWLFAFAVIMAVRGVLSPALNAIQVLPKIDHP